MRILTKLLPINLPKSFKLKHIFLQVLFLLLRHLKLINVHPLKILTHLSISPSGYPIIEVKAAIYVGA